jgi:hypothetical protein
MHLVSMLLRDGAFGGLEGSMNVECIVNILGLGLFFIP